MHHKLLPFLLAAVLVTPIAAQTPREQWEEVQTLFAQGHRFTTEEAEALDELQRRLVADGDTELAADLDLLRWAALVRNGVEEARETAEARRDEATRAWEEKEKFAARQQAWRTTRNGALTAFAVTLTSTLFLAAVIDNDENLLRNGYFDDYSERSKVVDGLRWAAGLSAGGALVSLFPLLWAEARQ